MVRMQQIPSSGLTLSAGCLLQLASSRMTAMESVPSFSLPANPANDFADLRKIVFERGYFKRQFAYYIYKSIEAAVLLTVGVVVLFVFDSVWVQLLNAAYLAFVFGQIGYLGHDAGHRQIFGNERQDDVLSYLYSAFIGLSPRHWIDRHNEHHAHTNREDMDPQNNVSVMAFSQQQAKRKRGWHRFMTKHQAWFFFPLLSFSTVTLRAAMIRYFLKSDIKRVWLDVLQLALHFVVYLGLVFWALPVWLGVVFVIVHQLLWGLYLGLAFAPNHKGMEVIGKDQKIDFLRAQVLTSRNVAPGLLTDFLYGGLNYQIEHHLFPHLPRINLRRVYPIVRQFCKERHVKYHETGVLQSYREIIAYMKEMGTFTVELEIM